MKLKRVITLPTKTKETLLLENAEFKLCGKDALKL